METTTETTVEREVEIAATPETVWEFLVDPEKVALVRQPRVARSAPGRAVPRRRDRRAHCEG